MKLKQERYIRFKDASEEESYSYMSRIRRGLKNGGLGLIFNDKAATATVAVSKKKKTTKTKILDPQGSFLQKWNKIFVVISIIAVSLDPLFFYIPVIDKNEKCLGMDNKMKIISCVLRTLIDLIYGVHIIFEFHTGFIAPSSRVFGRGELIEDSFAIAKRYLRSNFIIDVLSILPLPQVAILIIIPTRKGPVSLVTKDLLKFVIITQYIPRFFRMIPLFRQVTRTSGIFTETPWAGAAFNLFIYMLGSHVIGSFWYLFSIEREDDCWRSACNKQTGCNKRYLYCGEHHKRVGIYSFLNTTCTPLQKSDFDFGIFLDAFESHIVETKDFPQKFLYCFWWGLRNLSSLGQNLKTSTYVL